MSPKRHRHREERKKALAQGRSESGFGAETEVSYAQRYRDFKATQQSAELSEFQGLFDFPLDDFQIQACQVLDHGQDVLVTAPTSSGKTIVGLYGIFLALRQGRRLFYTTPIKALSNQKFLELSDLFGAENVGLLTGDNAVNGQAPIIVMTTEVLRNMIYAGAPLDDLGYVVMDEVHYLSDHFRGPVWEEIIIHLDPAVRLISLSATVSNAKDFAAWLKTLRGPTTVVSTTNRPVPLKHYMVLATGEVMPLFERGEVGGHLNRSLLAQAAKQVMPRRGRPPRRTRADRPAIAHSLEHQGLLPAIVFIFSRQGCNDAAAQVFDAGVRFTTAEEAEKIRIEIETTLAGFSQGDLTAIDVSNWEETLAAGIAAHHAGLLPIQKQLTESLFAKGLIRLVFATETLALGINMPARTVLIESLNKWNGQERVNLTPGEYTQLTGRAGRRGIDSVGYALTLMEAKNPPQVLANLASKQSYPLHSAFTPTFNMAANLLARTTLAGAKETVEKSFAQYEALGSSRKLFSQLRRFEDLYAQQAEATRCERGDVFTLLELMNALSKTEKQAKQRRHSGANTPENQEADRRAIERARVEMKSHPVYSCPERDKHLVKARQAAKNRESAELTRKRIENRTKSLSRQLEQICLVMQRLDYLDDDFHLTEAGVMLQSVYNERDLLVVECLRRGVFDHLSVPDLAGALSVCLAENRTGGLSRLIPAEASRGLASSLEAMARLNFEISSLQQEHYLDVYPPLETDLLTGVVAWAKDRSLGECLELSAMSAGDFVRAIRQVIDLADQLRKLDLDPALHANIRAVITKLKRGVVTWDF